MPEEHPLAPGETGSVSSYPAAAAAPAPAAAAAEVDLLGFGESTAAPAAPAAVTAAAAPTLTLNPAVSMSGDDYQAKWGAIADADATVSVVPLHALPSGTDQVERALQEASIMTMASGELPNEFKFFLYAEDAATGCVFLIQSNVEKTSEPVMVVTVKVSGGNGGGAAPSVESLVDLINKALN